MINPVNNLLIKLGFLSKEETEKVNKIFRQCPHTIIDKARVIEIKKENKIGSLRVCPVCSMMILEGDIQL